MKKSTLALLTAALVANSASALTVIDNKETGTKVDFSGSLRLVWKRTSDDSRDNKHINHAVANNGSRFGFRIQQDLGNDFYALGRVEWRMRGESRTQHDFDHIYTRQLYAGIGHKQYGELTYGHQTTIADEVYQTDLPNTLSLTNTYLNSVSRKTVQYVYNGIKGLRLGAFYGGSSQRGNNGLDINPQRDSVGGAAAIWRKSINDDHRYAVGFGVTQEEFKPTGLRSGYDRTAYALGLAYTAYQTTFAVDVERRDTENASGIIGNDRVEKQVVATVFHRLTGDWNIYTMGAYKTNKLKYAIGGTNELKRNQFMLGTEYWIARDFLKAYNLRAKTFVEWQTSRNKRYANSERTSKSRENTAVVGFRVYW